VASLNLQVSICQARIAADSIEYVFFRGGLLDSFSTDELGVGVPAFPRAFSQSLAVSKLL
jgi:hypothetical protein